MVLMTVTSPQSLSVLRYLCLIIMPSSSDSALKTSKNAKEAKLMSWGRNEGDKACMVEKIPYAPPDSPLLSAKTTFQLSTLVGVNAENGFQIPLRGMK
jgi:hypothetical protein